MRSPALVFSLMAVSALSPTFVAASPLPATESPALVERHRLASDHPIAPRGLGFLTEVFARTEPDRVPKASPTSKPKVISVADYTIGYVVVLLSVYPAENDISAQREETALGERLRRLF